MAKKVKDDSLKDAVEDLQKQLYDYNDQFWLARGYTPELRPTNSGMAKIMWVAPKPNAKPKRKPKPDYILEPTHPIFNERFRKITTKYPFHCRICGDWFTKGVEAYWYRVDFNDKEFESFMVCNDCYP